MHSSSDTSKIRHQKEKPEILGSSYKYCKPRGEDSASESPYECLQSMIQVRGERKNACGKDEIQGPARLVFRFRNRFVLAPGLLTSGLQLARQRTADLRHSCQEAAASVEGTNVWLTVSHHSGLRWLHTALDCLTAQSPELATLKAMVSD